MVCYLLLLVIVILHYFKFMLVFDRNATPANFEHFYFQEKVNKSKIIFLLIHVGLFLLKHQRVENFIWLLKYWVIYILKSRCRELNYNYKTVDYFINMFKYWELNYNLKLHLYMTWTLKVGSGRPVETSTLSLLFQNRRDPCQLTRPGIGPLSPTNHILKLWRWC